MKKSNIDTPGGRLRYFRRDILRMTQQEMAEKLGVNRSGIANTEGGKQGVSRKMLEMLQDLFGLNPTWLISGVGSPKMEGSAPHETNSIVSGMLESRPGSLTTMLTNPAAFVKNEVPGRFGYGVLRGTKVRLHAARDSDINGTELFELVENDQLWFAAGEPDGWEFEMMREYFDFGSDRSKSEWMEFLRTIRWIRSSLVQSVALRDLSDDVRSA